MFKLEKQKDKAVLTIYGYVGGLYLDFRAVNAALADITKSGYKNMDFHLHTYGGNVFDGNLICNFLSSFQGEVDLFIDGIAASMGALFTTSVKRVHIVDNGFVMIHAPRGGGEGTAADYEQNAKLLRSMEKNFVQKLVERTGKTIEEVNKWMDGTDYWFDADECVALGLADTKFSPKVPINTTGLGKKEAVTLGARATYDRFAASLIIDNTKNQGSDMNKAELIARYQLTGVNAESTDEQVLAAIDAKVNAGKVAQEEAATQMKKNIVAAVAKAVEDKKITKEQSDSYIARGEKLGLDDLNALLSELKPYQPITASIAGKTTANGGEDKGNWTWDDYQAKAVAELEAMQKKDPETFKALFKAKYGTEPEL